MKRISTRHFLRQCLAAIALLLVTTVTLSAGVLEDLYRDALSNDARLKAAQENWLAEEQNLTIDKAPLLPRVDLSGGYDSVDQRYQDSLALFNDARYRRNNAEISLSQPLYRPDLWRTYTETHASVNAARFELEAEKQAMALRLLEAVADVIRAQNEIATFKWRLNLLNKQLNQTRVLQREGMATVTDSQQYEAQIGLSKARLASAHSALVKARQSIAEITGHAPLQNLTLGLKPDSLILEYLKHPSQELVNRVLKNNPELKAAQWRSQAAKHRTETERAGRLPSVDLDASVSRQENLDGFNKGISNDTRVGVSVNLPLFHGMETSGRIQRARHLQQKSHHDYTQLQDSLVSRSKAALSQLKTNHQNLRHLKSAKASAFSALNGTLRAAQLGSRTASDVQSALRDWQEASRDLINAKLDLLMNGIELLSLTGHLDSTQISALNPLL